MKKIFLKRASQGRGFSLTETIIVLGVVGLVMAAIWATASVVRARQPIQDTVQLVTEIASNVRGIYAGFSTAMPPLAVAGQAAAGLFPDGIVNDAGTNTINAWGGTFFLNFNSPVGLGFSIEISLPATMAATERLEACLGMVTRLPATATNYGGGFAGTLPIAAVATDPTQGTSPSLALLRNGGAWVNVTASTVDQIITAVPDCRGIAFYYKI